MGKSSAPPPPDYTGVAKEQSAANKENLTQQTWANRADQYNPWGSQTWSSQQVVDPASGQDVTKWTQNTSLDPRLQGALDSQIAVQQARSSQAQGLIGRMNNEFGQQMDWGGLTPWANTSGMQAGGLQANTNAYGFGGRGIDRGLDFGGVQGVQGSDASRQRAEDAIYRSSTSRLDPQWQAKEAAMESKLAVQGITPGSAAYTGAMNDLATQRNDAYQQAQMQSITGAGAEAQRNQGMDLALRGQQVGEIGQQGQFQNAAQQQAYGQQLGQQQQAFAQQQAAGGQNFQQGLAYAQFQNQQRQQQLTEAMQQRGFSLNEINALLTGQQVQSPQFAGYSNAGLAETPDLMGAAKSQYQAGQDATSQKNAQTGQTLGSIASVAMMFSDHRLKADVRRIGTHARGVGIYSYRFIGERGRRVGVMAHELQRVAPELVDNVRGVLRVNYGGL